MRVISMSSLIDELVESFEYSKSDNDYIVETDTTFEIETDMPGVIKENIDITIKDDYLTITATRTPSKIEGRVIQASNIKEYTRSYRLGTTVNKSDIKAKYDNGILKVTVGKVKQSKPNKIVIE